MIFHCHRSTRVASLVLATMSWAPLTSARPRAVAIPEVRELFTDDPNLPGRDLVFTNLRKSFRLDDLYHPPVSPMMVKTYDRLRAAAARAQAPLIRDCRRPLEERTVEFEADLNSKIADYLEERGADVQTHAVKYQDRDGAVVRTEFRTLVLPTTGRSWHSRLARHLDQLHEPVRLFVYPKLFDGTRLVEQYSVTEEGLAIGLSPWSILPYAVSIALEHELFHVLQTQRRLSGVGEAWPDHVISSDRPDLFHGQARRYIAQSGDFALEEIGAATRDAVQTITAVEEEQLHRLAEESNRPPAKLIARERRIALSFAKGARRIYRRALAKVRAGELSLADVTVVAEEGSCEIRIDANTRLIVNRFDLGAGWADHVRSEIERGLRWIDAYRRFLVDPRKH